MKKLLYFVLFWGCLTSFSSCIYTDESYIPQAPYYYNTRIIDARNYVQRNNVIDVYFDTFTTSGRDYYFLMVEDPWGGVFLNGKRWSKVSDDFWFSPVTTHVDFSRIYPNTTYRCVIMSSWGNFSQEFNMYVY